MREIEIIETARKHLSIALADPRLERLPDAGWRWGSYCIQAREKINKFITPLEVVHFLQESQNDVGFEARMMGNQLIDYSDMMEKNCLEIFPHFSGYLNSFEESSLSLPKTLTVNNGRLVSSVLYNHIIHTMRCLTYVRPNRVAEIGGGYGAPARMWMINGIHRPKQYIDVDFPESLFYAECYLHATLPTHKIIYLSDENDIELVNQYTENAIFLCPIVNFEKLLEFDIDLITNTGSLQEMSEEYVSYYMKMIENSKCKTFYSFNYFAQPLHSLLESMNFGAPILSSKWLSTFKTFHSADMRSVAEILFTRSLDVCDEKNIKTKIDSHIKSGMPRDGAEFLELFDLIRQIDDKDFIIKFIEFTIKRMPYIPKETLFLAKKVNAPAKMIHKLEKIAISGRENMGIVGGTETANIRSKLMSVSKNNFRSKLMSVGKLVKAPYDRFREIFSD